jgi:hypothetical protein
MTAINMNLRFALGRMILAGLCAVSSVVPGHVRADAIAGLYTTGENGTPGQPDLNYTLV